jgi:O-methyltransferase involved in polyketide biosynthesis
MPDARVQALFQESLGKPHEARIFNVYLGGTDNYAIDRTFAARQLAKLPQLAYSAVQSRKWIARVVEHMARSGIRQIIDFGAGLPTEGAAHEILEASTQGECHVVYVDHDPMAAAHAHLILEELGKTEAHKVIQADIENHAGLWNAILSTGVINPSQPIGMIMAAVWHFVPHDKNPYQAMRAYQDAVTSGSQLAISHATLDGMSDEMLTAIKSVIADYDDEVTSKAFVRPLADIHRFFGDWTMIPARSGLPWLPQWNSPLTTTQEPHEDGDPTRSLMVCGLAQKP